MLNHSPEKEINQKEAISRKEIPEIEIKELKERIEKLEAQLKKEKIPIPEEREKIIKQEIKTYLRELQKLPPFAPPPVIRDEAEEIAKFPLAEQVGALVSLVFEKGLRQAISVAKALKNPAVLDEFHDTLVDRYYDVLIKKKILKKL
jgi:hypothetical protein